MDIISIPRNKTWFIYHHTWPKMVKDRRNKHIGTDSSTIFGARCYHTQIARISKGVRARGGHNSIMYTQIGRICFLDVDVETPTWWIQETWNQAQTLKQHSKTYQNLDQQSETSTEQPETTTRKLCFSAAHATHRSLERCRSCKRRR